MVYLPSIIIQTTNGGCGWHKKWYLVTSLIFISFQATSVFLSAFLEACGYSQTYFRKTVTLSMDLRAINLLVAAIMKFKIHLIKQIPVPTCQHYILAINWRHVSSRSPRQISRMLFRSEGIAMQEARVPWLPTTAGAGYIRETLQLALLSPTQGFSWHVRCKMSYFCGKAQGCCFRNFPCD